jgi:Ca2+-binding EF-hand superfamily protein
MIISTSELIGKSCEKQYAQNLAKKILDSCDTNRNGRITKEEFIIG